MEKITSKRIINKLDKNLSGRFSLDEELKKLNKNPLLKDVVVDIFNYNRLSLYVESCSNCKNCKGLSQCKNNAPGYALKLTNTNELTVEAHPCKYMIEDLKRKEKKSRFKTLYLSDELLNANFDNFRTTSQERIKAIQFVQNFVVNYDPKKTSKGLYVCGNFQIGKTYFLACAANYLAENNIESLLIYFPDLVRELKSSMNDRGSFESKINMIKKVPVLMLDDIGAEMTSPWLRDEILCPILNYRLMEHLPVFFSSNRNLDELISVYESIDSDSTNAQRVMVRIMALSSFIEFKE